MVHKNLLLIFKNRFLLLDSNYCRYRLIAGILDRQDCMSYLIICILALFVSALTLFSGFGLGTLLMPVLALFFPIEVALAATAIVHLF